MTRSGRISKIRIVGSKLFFIDLVKDGTRVQGLCNLAQLSKPAISLRDFKESYRLLRRGDIVSQCTSSTSAPKRPCIGLITIAELCGTPCRTPGGELSLRLSSLPQLLSPCLHIIPSELINRQTRTQDRLVDFLVDKKSAAILRLRSSIINHLRSYFTQHHYLEVQTPILASHAGGAMARPFTTSATEFPDRNISLRIAPELWLKRLVIGGFDKVFEIGPSFRNEGNHPGFFALSIKLADGLGLDSHHNPEFTTCEFYLAYADIEKLIQITETIFHSVQTHVKKLVEREPSLDTALEINFRPPYPRIDFISALETATNFKFPNLAASDALTVMTGMVSRLPLQLPRQVTLPKLLDQLSAKYLEPQCITPTFIINHPECLSPLSKSFKHPTLDQIVTARAELFVNGQEVVNTYEEENSPFEQRRKFVDQLGHRNADSPNASVDEDYLEALEWGLPPTGGWGAGIDRLCMLMLGVDRIGDVLSFGTLRNVVAPKSRIE